jgi:hypothetical protein
VNDKVEEKSSIASAVFGAIVDAYGFVIFYSLYQKFD